MRIKFDQLTSPELIKDTLQALIDEFGVELGPADLYVTLLKDGKEATIVDEDGEEVMVVSPKTQKMMKNKKIKK